MSDGTKAAEAAEPPLKTGHGERPHMVVVVHSPPLESPIRRLRCLRL